MTLAARVIPCLDVSAGRVVKGVNFQDLRDMGDPVELAAHYAAQGADEITFLDVTATVDARATTYEVVQRTAEQVFVPLTVGGGVRSVDDVARATRATTGCGGCRDVVCGLVDWLAKADPDQPKNEAAPAPVGLGT